MTYELIMLDKPVIVSNDNIVEGDQILGMDNTVYDVKSRTTNDKFICYSNGQYVGDYGVNSTIKKVVAQSHQIDWNGLEKDFRYVDIKSLASALVKNEIDSIKLNDRWGQYEIILISGALIHGFESGFETAKKLFNQSEPARYLIDVELELATGSDGGYEAQPKFRDGKLKILKKLYV